MTEKRFKNRLDKSNIKFNTLNPVWDNEKEDALNVFEMIDELNRLNIDCNNSEKENEQLKEDLDYFKSKNGSLETGMFNLEREIDQLKIQLQNTSDQRDEFGKSARENANRVGQLKKENKHLQKENMELNQVIDNLRCGLSEIDRNYDQALESERNTMDENFLLLKDSIQLEKENGQLKEVKSILQEYDNVDYCVDSAMAIDYIERIARAVGMELKE